MCLAGLSLVVCEDHLRAHSLRSRKMAFAWRIVELCNGKTLQACWQTQRHERKASSTGWLTTTGLLLTVTHSCRADAQIMPALFALCRHKHTRTHTFIAVWTLDTCCCYNMASPCWLCLLISVPHLCMCYIQLTRAHTHTHASNMQGTSV